MEQKNNFVFYIIAIIAIVAIVAMVVSTKSITTSATSDNTGQAIKAIIASNAALDPKTPTPTVLPVEVSDGTKVRLDLPDSRIYLNEGFKRSLITKNDLKMLADGSVIDTNNVQHPYTQYILTNGTAILRYSQHDISDVNNFYAFDLSNSVFDPNYAFASTIQFSSPLNATSYNIIGQKATLFAKDFYFGPDTTDYRLVLYPSSLKVSMSVNNGTSTPLNVSMNNAWYYIRFIGVGGSGNRVVLSVNGMTDSIAVRQSKTINGLKIYVTNITSWNNGTSGTTNLILFGGDKIIIQDGQSVLHGSSEDMIAGTRGSIMAYAGRNDQISSIRIYVNAPDSDHDYIAVGKTFIDPVYGTFQIDYVDNTKAFNSIYANVYMEAR